MFVGVRIRPNILAGGQSEDNKPVMKKAKFGIPVDLLSELLTVVDEDLRLEISQTLHIHTGHAIFYADVFVQGIKVLTELVPYYLDLEIIDLWGDLQSTV